MPENITTEYLSVPGSSGSLHAFLAQPAAGGQPRPAILLIHEVFGLVDHIEDLAQRFAGAGYLVLAPDLYTDDPRRPGITVADIENALRLAGAADFESAVQQLPTAEQEGARKASEWRAKRDSASQIPNLLAVLRYLKGRPDVRPEAVAAVGFCMGGGLVGRLAGAGADLAAGVIYYGPPPPAEEIPNIRCALQGHYGGTDTPITSKVPDFAAAAKAQGKDYTPYIYEGAPHGFSNDTRTSYTPDAAALAWQRTLDFLERHLSRAAIPA